MWTRIILAIAMAGLVGSPALGAVPASERGALLALFESLDHSGALQDRGWGGSPGTECEWGGVTCDPDRLTVVGLEIVGGLTGRLPAEIGELTNLETLRLREGEISGPIPPEIGRLAHLKTLALDFNRLSGPIPPEIGQLARLEELELSMNPLNTPIPPEIGELSELRQLSLNWTGLQGGLPPELGNLGKLENLWLNVNALTGEIPEELARAERLRSLVLSANRLTGPIPPALGRLPRLEFLDLYFNNLTGEVPGELAALSNLSRFDLRMNRLTGPMPDFFAALPNLRILGLGYNPWDPGPIPESLRACQDILFLDLGEANRIGPIPEWLGELSSLQVLYLNDNAFDAGPVPLLPLAGLSYLNLNFTHRTGPIPDWLGSTTYLRVLKLRGNPFTPGPLPEWLRNVGRPGPFGFGLQILDLGQTHRTGPLPHWLSELGDLELLYLDGNRLTGIPSVLRRLPKLHASDGLDVRWNSFSSGSPALVEALARLHPPGTDWRDTQTVPPPRPVATATSRSSVRLTWQPVRYREARGGDPGQYLIWASRSPQPGTGILVGGTFDKNTRSFEITGLKPGTRYYFVIRTVTWPHPRNPDRVTSLPSDQVTATPPRR